jgi:hypothetical protein
MSNPLSKQLVVCVLNEGYPASLEKRKIYVALRDPTAEKHGQLRVIDESGDDYLYPKGFFRSIALPDSIKKAVLAAA